MAATIKIKFHFCRDGVGQREGEERSLVRRKNDVKIQNSRTSTTR